MEIIGGIQAFTLQFLMLFFFYEDDQVTIRSAPLACISLPGNIELHSFLNACRDINGYCFLPINSSFSFAYRAFCGYCRSFAVAGGTGRHGLHLAKESV